MPTREAAAMACCANTHGAMEIILGLVAFQHGLIHENMLVGIVVMALLTSVTSGPLLRHILQLQRAKSFCDHTSNKMFAHQLQAKTAQDAIRELAQLAGPPCNLDPAIIADNAWGREQLMPTGMEHGLAVPHARLATITNPAIAIG